MLGKLLGAPQFRFAVDGEELTYRSIKEFEFAMSGRTELPARKLAALMELSLDELRNEARAIRKVDQQFASVLSSAMEDGDTLRSYVSGIELKVFSNDHRWRDIISALREQNGDYHELRRIALVKYLQYLDSRQQAIKHIYSFKKQYVPRPPASGDDTMNLSETVILDTTILAKPVKLQQPFTRLPKGEPVTVILGAGEVIELLLSKHPFLLESGTNAGLTDAGGVRHPLAPGKNIIGRDSVCHVVTTNALRDISRMHLIIENLPDHSLRLTDLSAHGCSLPSRFLPATEED